jgi:prevent-host-death family protein
MNTQNVVGLKELRENINDYISQVDKGKSFIVVKRSKPIFKISPPMDDDNFWEPVVDFTRVKKGGVRLDDVLSRL